MFIFAILLVVSVDQLFADPRPCTADDYCRPVPADVCDNSLCLPFEPKLLKQLNEFGDNGVKMYTWNVVQQVYLRYCPLHFQYVVSQAPDNRTAVAAVFQFSSNPYCNSTFSAGLQFYGTPDPATGQIKFLTIDLAGATFQACYIHFEHKVASVLRLCRVGPPPAEGQACAMLFVKEAAAGNCKRKKLNKFLDSLRSDLNETVVDCY